MGRKELPAGEDAGEVRAEARATEGARGHAEDRDPDLRGHEEALRGGPQPLEAAGGAIARVDQLVET